MLGITPQTAPLEYPQRERSASRAWCWRRGIPPMPIPCRSPAWPIHSFPPAWTTSSSSWATMPIRRAHELSHKNVTIVVNTDYGEGLSKSLRHGLKMLPSETSAVMLSLGNRPFVSREVVSRLIQAYREGGSRVVVPSYSQMRGHPVIFDASVAAGTPQGARQRWRA